MLLSGATEMVIVKTQVLEAYYSWVNGTETAPSSGNLTCPAYNLRKYHLVVISRVLFGERKERNSSDRTDTCELGRCSWVSLSGQYMLYCLFQRLGSILTYYKQDDATCLSLLDILRR